MASRLKLGWELEDALKDEKNKNISRKYQANGKIFPNLKELALEAGISYEAAVKRVHRGWSDEEVFNGRAKKESKPKEILPPAIRGNPITVGDSHYNNLIEAYNDINPKCTFNAVRARLRGGWTPEEALELQPKVDGRKHSKRAISLNIDGETLTLSEASEKYQVPYSTILDRVNRKATHRQAVGLDPIPKKSLETQHVAYAGRKKRVKRLLVVNEVSYKNVAELARAYGLDPALVYNRINMNGWTPEEAVKPDVTNKVIVNGIEYRSAMNAWDEIGKTAFTTYAGRKSQGLPLEVCLGLEPLPKQYRYELNGVSYTSLGEVADAYGISHTTLQSRMAKMTLEEAISYTPNNGRFTEKTFARSDELANAPGRLYFVKIQFTEMTLHKVGITQRMTHQRFLNYNFQSIVEVTGTLVKMHELEKKVLEKFRCLHHRAQDDFEGRTETFLMNSEQEKEVQEFILRESGSIGQIS